MCVCVSEAFPAKVNWNVVNTVTISCLWHPPRNSLRWKVQDIQITLMANWWECTSWKVAEAATDFSCDSLPSEYKSSAWTDIVPWNSEKSFWTRYDGVLYVLQKLIPFWPGPNCMNITSWSREIFHLFISRYDSDYKECVQQWSKENVQRSSKARQAIDAKTGTPVIVKGNHGGWISVRTGSQPVIVKHNHICWPAPVLCVHKERRIRSQLDYVAVPFHSCHKASLCHSPLHHERLSSQRQSTTLTQQGNAILSSIHRDLYMA